MEERDYWDMTVTNGEEILAITGTKLTPFREVLLIVKKYMEDRRCQIFQCAIQRTVN